MIAGYVTNVYEITDTYKKLLLNARDAGVEIEPSSDNTTKLVIFEKKRRPYEFSIQDDTLTIRSSKTRWYHHLRIGIDRSAIKLYIPKSGLDEISVKATVGHVDISSINCGGAIELEINTGKMKLDGVSCKAFGSKGNTGSLTLNHLIATENISIKRNTGTVSLNDCSAPEIFVKTNTGSVCGKLPHAVAFSVHTNTGKVKVPKATIGEAICGRCEIKTNTGNIIFE